MPTETNLTDVLLAQIQRGETAQALERILPLLEAQPNQPGLLTLKAEALRLSGRAAEAIEAFRRAGAVGGGPRNWLVAGLMLGDARRTDEAMACLLNAIAEDPNNEEVLNALVTTLFNANRHKEGVFFARRLLAGSSNGRHLTNAALLLQSNELYEEAADVFKRLAGSMEQDPTLLGAALVPARFTCEWDWIESIQRRMEAQYEAGQFAATQEYPLTHLTWCSNEAYNLEVTRAYASRMQPDVPPLVTTLRKAEPGARIRVGYLSSDFCNHATMHLMAGLLESHDRERFEVFAYDHSRPDGSEYRQRFLNAVEHHRDITAMTDADAAAQIAGDELDLLFDLKGHTGWGRLGIMAHRPAPLQVAYLGFPGTTATPFIDYLVADRFVTPDSSAPFYSERLCRLPHSYQCNDRQRPVAGDPGTRAEHGLPQDAVVFCAFNQSYKIDRNSFNVWMRILAGTPGSVLWLLTQGEAAERNLKRQAELAGIASHRLIFAGFAAPERHIARLRLADAALDALICNGHTTTSDTLWAGTPVITTRGRHFASRVSESLLNAMELPELVASDADDMVRLAVRFGNDAAFRQALREKVAANIARAPLFDTERFTRNFEQAIRMMVDASRAARLSGQPLVHLDVPDYRGAQPSSAASESSLQMLPGHALRHANAICIERRGGMGDVLMALAAAKALKTVSERPVAMVTAPAFRQLAEACPHIDLVTEDRSVLTRQFQNLRHVDLNPAAYGISRMHQVDAYLQAFGLSAEPRLKELDLVIDPSTEDEVARLIASWPSRQAGRARVLLHIGQGDPNRIWPLGHWAEVASTLVALGHQVVAIGSMNTTAVPASVPAVPGLLSAVNALSMLGTVALMRQSDLLIAADSGPVQLAAASDIGIVGLYSVVEGACRLPFRHGEAQWRAIEVKPSCSFYPCYQQLHNPEVMAPFNERLQNGTLGAGELLANWCPDGGSFACLSEQISVAMVLDAVQRLDSQIFSESAAIQS